MLASQVTKHRQTLCWSQSCSLCLRGNINSTETRHKCEFDKRTVGKSEAKSHFGLTVNTATVMVGSTENLSEKLLAGREWEHWLARPRETDVFDRGDWKVVVVVRLFHLKEQQTWFIYGQVDVQRYYGVWGDVQRSGMMRSLDRTSGEFGMWLIPDRDHNNIRDVLNTEYYTCTLRRVADRPSTWKHIGLTGVSWLLKLLGYSSPSRQLSMGLCCHFNVLLLSGQPTWISRRRPKSSAEGATWAENKRLLKPAKFEFAGYRSECCRWALMPVHVWPCLAVRRLTVQIFFFNVGILFVFEEMAKNERTLCIYDMPNCYTFEIENRIEYKFWLKVEMSIAE